MPGTDPTTRQAPPRRFENYVLTRLVDPSAGLTEVRDDQFTQLSGSAAIATLPLAFNVGQGFADDAYSTTGLIDIGSSGIPFDLGLKFSGSSGQHPFAIGFDFQLDGIVYKQFVANVNGWMALVDPTLGTFNPEEVLDLTRSNALFTGSPGYVRPWTSALVLPTFTSNAVLLAPWWDALKNTANVASTLTNFPTSFTADQVARITAGIDPRPTQLNGTAYGVSYYHDRRSPKGRRLIVRWNSLSNFTQPSTVLKFEVVLYENGTIEYRYVPRTALSAQPSAVEGATIGIFMPNGTNRFRDFAVGLGYRDDARIQYVYGGFTSSSYTDPRTYYSNPPLTVIGTVTASYTTNLKPFLNWPGLNTQGSVFTFSPPVARRQVLPRKDVRQQSARLSLPLVGRTGDDRTGTFLSAFDDRRTPNYGSTAVVNYPTTLPRFFGGTGMGTLERQDLFSGDFLATGSTNKGAIEPYTNEGPQLSTPAFNDHRRPDQDPGASASQFYLTGTSNVNCSSGFEQPLKAKTQIRLQLPVCTTIQMPGLTSSIYYYNSRTHAWNVPSNSSTGSKSDWANPQVDAQNGRIIEDARGFGPVGNIVSSGSHVPAGSGDQTDASIGDAYDPSKTAAAIGKLYPKSTRNNEDYRPTTDETFTLPINAPFLIEKMVVEVPFQAGPGWFNDQTQCFVPLSGSTAFDFAGPALTVALSRNVSLAETSGQPSVRDLILTGTITHTGDNVSTLVVSSFSPLGSATQFQLRPVGFLAYAGPAGAVVSGSNLAFTGSVVVQCQALSAVGPVLRYQQVLTNSSSVNSLLAQATVQLTSGTTHYGYISPIGRGGLGDQPAGRCILGNEVVTLQGLVDPTGASATNPFADPSPSAQLQAAIAAMTAITASAAIPMATHFPAPYLVLPGDRLVLSISKMRPVVYTANGAAASGSASGHDIALTPGSVNVTLYGSQVQAGAEYHDALNQPLGSDNVHEVIGTDAVVDQFEVAYRNEYSGSFSDNVMTGMMLQQQTGFRAGTFTNPGITAFNFLTPGTRDRRLSKLNARNVPTLSTSSFDLALTPSKAYRLQPWFEQVGSVRPTQFQDSAERFYDSLMPNISECFNADGSAIFLLAPNGLFGNFPGSSGSVGYAWFDNTTIASSATSFGTLLINLHWTHAFPFEPRYLGASRLLDVSRGFLATVLYGPSDSDVTFITPVAVSGFFLGPSGGTPVVSDVITVPNNWAADVDLGSSITGSASTSDISRVLYGFGDHNTVSINGPNRDGTNHFAAFRDQDGPVASPGIFPNFYQYSPIIRGWKYGVYSGLPTFSKCYWRRGKFGQFRDMLEQRPDTKFYQSTENGPVDPNFKEGTQQAAVRVKFVGSDGRLTDPANTFSSNLSLECTSSIPYVDGLATNRGPINLGALNQSIVAIRQNPFGNISL